MAASTREDTECLVSNDLESPSKHPTKPQRTGFKVRLWTSAGLDSAPGALAAAPPE